MELITQVRSGNLDGAIPFVDELFDQDPSQAVEALKNVIIQLDENSQNENEQVFIYLLDSAWNFFSSLLSISLEANFPKALEHIQRASFGFNELQLTDYQELSRGMESYISAIVDINSLNVQSGLEKLNEAKDIFQGLDKYGAYFADMIAAFEMESLYLSGMQAMIQRDFTNGQILVSKAAKAAAALANNFEDTALEYYRFMGISHLYKAISGFLIQNSKLNSFNFEHFHFLDENEAADEAKSAISNFFEMIDTGELAKQFLNVSKGIEIISQVTFYLGQTMYAILINKISNIEQDVKPYLKLLKFAVNYFTNAGESGAIYVRLCNEMEIQLKNLDQFMNVYDINYKKAPKVVVNIKSYQKLIGDGKIGKALELLLSSTEDNESFEQVILLKGNYSRLEHNKLNNLVGDEKYGVELTKIAKRILDLAKKT